MAIENISDTARWVAAFRARESERPDALFRDPFARMLAGERGFELTQRMRGAHTLQWAMAVRTRVIDEFILEAVRTDKVDAVVNLAAGLDARPQRLQLPKSLTWIEADLPGIFDHKESVLGDVAASCKLERVRVDLADDAKRLAFIQRLGRDFKRALVLTEGLLIYLPEQAVVSLARDLHAQAGIAFWMMDLTDWRALRVVQVLWNSQLATGDARMQFGPRQGGKWFEQFGWMVRSETAFIDAGARLKRGTVTRLWAPLTKNVPKPLKNLVRDTTGIVWLER